MLSYLFLIVIVIIITRYYTNYENFVTINIKTFYINLKHRIDRKKHIVNQIKKIGISSKDINRIDAVKRDNGHLGCALSHIKTLTKILKLNLDYALVLEDDFMWKYGPELTKKVLAEVFKIKNWGICLLSCNGSVTSKQPYINSVLTCQTTSGYIIHKSYVKTLLNHWQSYIDNKYLGDKYNSKFKINGYETAIDQSWKILQKRDYSQWICTDPILGKQMPSHSDIQGQYVNSQV